ncbi:serine hydrolase [Rheinheimera baltica]|uniref:serine hydrolase n=1 Tax=Rheinheimera baltica TaxID=67576 RepID=UPI00273D9858|nr:serine hydrolase [Rheinheimera baltica]MDP5189208.1 serine hydrolase [Rheinheimera baltica]
MQKFRSYIIYALLFVPAALADCFQLNITSACHNFSSLLNKVPDTYPMLQKVFADPAPYKVQIIYTQIDRDTQNKPHLSYYQYNVDESRYFYPASSVKLPIALLALEWLNEQNVEQLTTETTMFTDAALSWQTAAHIDDTSATKLPSMAHYIKKILLVSDNDASNRLYELLGQERINAKLAEKGLTNSLITHRLSTSLTEQQNRQYNPIRFIGLDNTLLLELPARESVSVFHNKDEATFGKGYIDNGNYIDQPMDFTAKNRQSLANFDGVIKRLVFPELFSKQQQFALSSKDREFVLRYMSMLPSESDYPSYNTEQFPDNYSKFLMFAGEPKSLPANIRIFNKTGWAYGHIVDGGYFVDIENQVEFFLTAVIYTNKNDILNDDQYETKQVAYPFLNELGNYIYQYELNRAKPIRPDLTDIKKIISKSP